MDMHTASTPDRIVRPREAAAITGVSVTTLWRMRRRGDLPSPIRVSPGAVGWRLSDLTTWLDQRAQAGR